MTRFVFGFLIYFKGLRTWLGSRRLMVISIVPLVLDFFALVIGIYFTATHISRVVGLFLSSPQLWYQHILYWLAFALAAIGLFLVAVFAVFMFANVIAFPFNDRLAEAALELKGIELFRPKTRGERISKTLRNLLAMLERMPLFAAAWGVMGAATLIPGLGAFAALLGALLMSADRIDYSCDHYQLSFRQRMEFIRTHFPEFLGFSAGLGLITLIPVIGFLLIPGGIVAGAELMSLLKPVARRAFPNS